MSDTLMKNSLRTIKVLKVFGFASITIENEKSVTKPTDFLFFIGNLLLGFILSYESIKYRKELVSSNSEIIEIGNFITFVASIGISLISMFLAFWFRHKNWDMVLNLKEVDNKFTEIGAKFNQDIYNQANRWYKFGIILVIFTAIPLNCAIYIIEQSFLKSSLYCYTLIYYILSVGTVVGIMNGIRLRIKLINEVLEPNLNKFKIVYVNKSSAGKTETYRALMDIYGRLMEVNDSINICHGIPTMLGFGFLFFYTIFTSFMAYKDISNDGALRGVTIGSLMYSSYVQLFATLIILLCASTENEAQQTLKQTNSVLKQSKNDVEVAMLISFSSFVKRRLPKFSCGLFDFDWTLLYGVG